LFYALIGVYLHDPRCICKEAKTKTRRKNKEDVVLDALFWPVMPFQMVASKLDANRQPHVIQSYSVPLPQNDQYRKHDACVYSIWMHFVDFCLANSESTNMRNADAAPCYMAPDVPINAYSGEARLPFFRELSASPVQTLSTYNCESGDASAAAAFSGPPSFGSTSNSRRSSGSSSSMLFGDNGNNIGCPSAVADDLFFFGNNSSSRSHAASGASFESEADLFAGRPPTATATATPGAIVPSAGGVPMARRYSSTSTVSSSSESSKAGSPVTVTASERSTFRGGLSSRSLSGTGPSVSSSSGIIGGYTSSAGLLKAQGVSVPSPAHPQQMHQVQHGVRRSSIPGPGQAQNVLPPLSPPQPRYSFASAPVAAKHHHQQQQVQQHSTLSLLHSVPQFDLDQLRIHAHQQLLPSLQADPWAEA
jgi:hypothetical protein